LEREDRARKQAGQQHDEEAADAHELHRLKEQAKAKRGSKSPYERFGQHHRCTTEALGRVDDALA
jgi:hypothetical protein